MEKKTVKVAIDLPESFLEDYADFKALRTYIRQHRKCGDVFLPTNEAIAETGIMPSSPYFGVLGIIERCFAVQSAEKKEDNDLADLKALKSYIQNKMPHAHFISPTIGACKEAGISRDSPNLEILGLLERILIPPKLGTLDVGASIFLCNYEKPKY